MKAKFLFVAIVLVLLIVTATAFAGAKYIGNKRSKKLHDPSHSSGAYSCQAYIKKMANKNKVYFKSEKAANKKGYYLCKPCSY